MTSCKFTNIKKEDKNTIKFDIEFNCITSKENSVVYNAEVYILPNSDTTAYLELLEIIECTETIQLSTEIPLIGYIENPNIAIINKIKDFINLIVKEKEIFGYENNNLPMSITNLSDYIKELAFNIKSEFSLNNQFRLYDEINRTIAEMLFNDLLIGRILSPISMSNIVNKIIKNYQEDFDMQLNDECIKIIKDYINKNWFK